MTMNILQFIIMIFHIIIVFIVGTTIMISTNKYTLLILFILVLLVYLQALAFDGCVASKIEGTVPFTDVKANDIVLSFFGLTTKDIVLKNLEKVLIGFTLFFIGVKLGCVLIFEHIFKNTFYNQMCIFLSSKKSWQEKLISCYI